MKIGAAVRQPDVPERSTRTRSCNMYAISGPAGRSSPGPVGRAGAARALPGPAARSTGLVGAPGRTQHRRRRLARGRRARLWSDRGARRRGCWAAASRRRCRCPGSTARRARGDPFAYVPGARRGLRRPRDRRARPTCCSPRARVGRSRRRGGSRRFVTAIDAAASRSGVDPATLEGIVYLESAGVPDAIAGGDPADAAGLTQIEPHTGHELLGMQIDLNRSSGAHARRSNRVDRATRHGRAPRSRARAKVDERFDPRKALARDGALPAARPAAVRPLGPGDRVLPHGHRQSSAACWTHTTAARRSRTCSCTSTPPPIATARAYRLLSSFGDDSWTYYWRVLAAEQIMSLYRERPRPR